MHVRRRAAAVTAAIGLTAALLPLSGGAAAADPTGPSFAFVTSDFVTGAHTDETDRLWASAPGNLSSETLLSPDSFVYRYDVSDDGNTMILGGQSRKLSLPSLNVTAGLLLVRRDPLTQVVTTKVLSTYFDTNPAISADGSKAFWMVDGILYTYDVQAGAVVAASSRFKPTAIERPSRLAVSPDGTKAAVIFSGYKPNGDLNHRRIKAGALPNGVGPVYEQSGIAVEFSDWFPTTYALTWTADSSAVLFDMQLDSVQFAPFRAVPGVGATELSGFRGAYDFKQLNGSWYLFREATSPDRTQLGSSSDFVTAPTDWTTFPRGQSSSDYRASTLTPPAVTQPAVRATATANVYFSPTSVPTGGKAMYGSLATYLTDLTGTLAAPDNSSQTRYGVLSKSIDGGKTFTTVGRTGAAKQLLLWPTGGRFGNGYSPALTRNTWFRWCFEGDVYVAPDCSPVKKVVVLPTVSVGVEKIGSKKRIYGSTKRSYGQVALQRFTGRITSTIGFARISSSGRFSFTARSLAPGTYRVVTLADTSWGTGIKKFTVS
jgi:hypothetical protein